MGDRLVLGCGYLGRRIAALWQAQGHRVLATARSESKAAELRQLGLEPVLCDVMAPDTLAVVPAVQTVVLCIAPDRGSGVPMRELYVQGLANVLDHLPAPARFVYVSSTSVYGQNEGELVDESWPTEPVEESGRVMREAEQLLHGRLPGAVILRLAGIYGPGRLLRLASLLAGEPVVGDGERWLNLIHVEDGAAAVLAAEARAEPGGVYNVCDDRPIPRREFYALLARLIGAPEPRFIPPPPGSPAPRHESANRRISNRRLRTELGLVLRYPTYEEGLPASV
jgi:nucleoside-diphosphate-sugar epimerase